MEDWTARIIGHSPAKYRNLSARPFWGVALGDILSIIMSLKGAINTNRQASSNGWDNVESNAKRRLVLYQFLKTECEGSIG